MGKRTTHQILILTAVLTSGCGDLVATAPQPPPAPPPVASCDVALIGPAIADLAPALSAALDGPNTQDGQSCANCHKGADKTPTGTGTAWGTTDADWAPAVLGLLALPDKAKGGPAGNVITNHINQAGSYHGLNEAAYDSVQTFVDGFFANGGNACASCGNKEVTLPAFAPMAGLFAANACTNCHGGTSTPTGIGIAWGTGGIDTADAWHDAVATLSGPNAANDIPFNSYSIYLHVTTDDGNHNVPDQAAAMLAWVELFAANGGADCGGGGAVAGDGDGDVGGDGDGDGDPVIPPFVPCDAYQPATPLEIEESFTFSLLGAFAGQGCASCHVQGASGGLQYDQTRDGILTALAPFIEADTLPDSTSLGAKLLTPPDTTHINAAQTAGFNTPLMANMLREYIDHVANGVCFVDPNIPPPVCDPVVSYQEWSTRALGGTDSFPQSCYQCHTNRNPKADGISWGTAVQDAPTPQDWHDAAICSVGLDITNAGFDGTPQSTDFYKALNGETFATSHVGSVLAPQYAEWIQWRMDNCADYVCP